MVPERAAELIAWLTADVQGWDRAVMDFEALRRDDVILALAMVKSVPAQLVARIKYADQTEHTGSLENELLSAIERGALGKVVDNLLVGKNQQWKLPRAEFIRDMCRLAIAEMISPRLCPNCCGRGVIGGTRRNHKLRDCDRCQKSGRVSYKHSDRASVMGVSRQAWDQSWKERYQAIQCLIDRYDSIATGGVAKRLAHA